MPKLKEDPANKATGKVKVSKQIQDKPIEVTLWDAANKLRGSVEPAEYKHVVLSLIFLKFASDKFEDHRAKLIADGKEKYIEMPDFYNMSNVFFLEENSRWGFLIKKSKQNDIALLIDTALHTIEKNNKALKGALPDNYFSRLGLDITKLASLLDTINDIDTLKDPKQDVVGKVYEYFLSKFALAEGKGKGEFYTPKSIVNLIAEMIEPYKGIIYDPACGSGGMFVQSIKFIEAHHGNKKEVSIYGQEYTNTTYKLAKMNLAIRGIAGNLGEKAADTFHNDQHPDLKADFIMANPPFNQKDWRAANELTADPRWLGYEVPSKSNANYGWILNMVSKLSENGLAGFVLANGALSGGGEEYKIRRKLIKNNLVEAIMILPQNMFYTTNISVTIWIINKNKKEQVKQIGDETRHLRNRENEVLFLDLRQIGEPFEKKFIQFSPEHIGQIANTYHSWQQNGNSYENVPEFCYSATVEEIEKKDYSLVPSKYIEFVNRDENVNFDEKMKKLQAEFKDLLISEEKSKQDLLKVFKTLGYEIG
jgi:type I restriction enzyme M protein